MDMRSARFHGYADVRSAEIQKAGGDCGGRRQERRLFSMKRGDRATPVLSVLSCAETQTRDLTIEVSHAIDQGGPRCVMTVSRRR
jgi:hypothetical protein